MAEEPHPHLPRVRTAYEGSMWTETVEIKIVSPDALPEDWPAAPTNTLVAVLFWYISHFGNYGEPPGHVLHASVLPSQVLTCRYMPCKFRQTSQNSQFPHTVTGLSLALSSETVQPCLVFTARRSGATSPALRPLSVHCRPPGCYTGGACCSPEPACCCNVDLEKLPVLALHLLTKAI